MRIHGVKPFLFIKLFQLILANANQLKRHLNPVRSFCLRTDFGTPSIEMYMIGAHIVLYLPQPKKTQYLASRIETNTSILNAGV